MGFLGAPSDLPGVMESPTLPYGPHTAAIRHFLVRLAGLSRSDRAQAASAYAAEQCTPEFQRAESMLATAMERSGRAEARDALSGPFLQLVRRTDATDDTAPDALDPIAEPALAALMALLVRDLLTADVFTRLTAPMATVLDPPAGRESAH